MVRLTRKEHQDKINLLASINKVNIVDEVEATDNDGFKHINDYKSLSRYSENNDNDIFLKGLLLSNPSTPNKELLVGIESLCFYNILN
uniref:Uncharacterized protein n=1 Tax=Glossina austeni TaxID=7395 RepID=A0A1A9V6Y6_GLOAU